MDILLNNLGETIKKLRKLKKLSQRELAKLANVSDATVSKLENNSGNITMESIQRIVKALGFTFEEVIEMAKNENMLPNTTSVLNSTVTENYNNIRQAGEKKIGEIIKRHRKMKGITLEQLANMIGVNPTVLSNMENGIAEIQIFTLKKVANALGMTVDEIIEEAEKEDMKTKSDISQEKDLKAFLNGLDGIMFYEGKPMSETEINVIKSIIEALMKNKISQNKE